MDNLWTAQRPKPHSNILLVQSGSVWAAWAQRTKGTFHFHYPIDATLHRHRYTVSRTCGCVKGSREKGERKVKTEKGNKGELCGTAQLRGDELSQCKSYLLQYCIYVRARVYNPTILYPIVSKPNKTLIVYFFILIVDYPPLLRTILCI